MLLLVRHGEPETAWGEGVADPGLSAAGQAQAEEAARLIAPRGPARLVCSPLQRCRQTAAPIAAATGLSIEIEPRIAEVATPPGVIDRRAWLAQHFPFVEGAFSRLWRDAPEDLLAWRAQLSTFLGALEPGTVLVSHFVALNVLLGLMLGREETVVTRLGLASVHLAQRDNGRWTVEAVGAGRAAAAG